MKLTYHLLSSAIIAIFLYPFIGISSLYVFIGGFLIDLDHPVYYFMRFHSLNLKKLYNFFTSAKLPDYRIIIRPFHNIELLAVLLFLNWIIALGMAVHMVMDMIYEKKRFGELNNYSLTLIIAKRLFN